MKILMLDRFDQLDNNENNENQIIPSNLLNIEYSKKQHKIFTSQLS